MITKDHWLLMQQIKKSIAWYGASPKYQEAIKKEKDIQRDIFSQILVK